MTFTLFGSLNWLVAIERDRIDIIVAGHIFFITWGYL